MPPLTAELRRLLALAGCNPARAAGFGWWQVVMVHNVARIPPACAAPDDSVWTRGFNLLILDATGTPASYVKCRAAGGPRLARETRIVEALARDPVAGAHVPRSRRASSPTMELQVSPYIRGRSFELGAQRLSASGWMSDVAAILDTAEMIARRASVACAGILDFPRLVTLPDAGSPAIEQLAQMGLPSRDCDALHAALASAGSLQAEPQHGDLWPANVIAAGHLWILLDFERYGDVQVPLFDAFHILRSAAGLRTEPGRPWLAAMAGDDGWTRAARRLLREAARRHGLRPEAVTGAFTFYLARTASDLYRTGNPQEFWEGRLVEAALLAQLLRDGEPVARRLMG